jgi:hypothetical protein
MRHLKFVTFGALGVVLLSATTATSATAAEGPFWKTKNPLTRLGAGETVGIESKQTKAFVLSIGTIKVECGKEATELGGVLNGSGTGHDGGSTDVKKFTSCVITGNGTPCEIQTQTITTTSLHNELDWVSSLRAGKFVRLWSPVSSSAITTIKMVGAGCKLTEITVEGSVASEVQNEAGTTVEAGEASEVAGVKGFDNFPTTPIKAVFIEREGKLTEDKPSLTAAGKTAGLVGRSEIKLTNGEKWGTFSK